MRKAATPADLARKFAQKVEVIEWLLAKAGVDAVIANGVRAFPSDEAVQVLTETSKTYGLADD